MRVLQAIWDGGGNTAPQLAVARALAARGHEVRMLAHDCQRAKVEAAGARFVAYRHAPQGDASRPETDLLRDWEARTPIGAFARTRDRLMYGPAAAFARDVLETLEAAPADVVAWDYLLLGAGLGAERAGVRSVALVHHIYPAPVAGVPPFGLGLQPAAGAAGRARDALLAKAFRRLFVPGMKAFGAARAELGLPPHAGPFDQLDAADLVLVMTAPELDFAARAPVPANVRFVGAAVERGGAWESPWPSGDARPLVVVSLSTTYMDQQALAGRAIQSLAGLPARVLVTAGPAIDADALPRAENVEVRGFVAHAAVLPEAALVVSHGGMGTVHAALAAGVPLVLMPQGRDQADVAARVVAAGAGVRTTPRRLRGAVERALADPSLRAGAERMRDAIAARDGAAGAADAIEAAARAAPPHRVVL